MKRSMAAANLAIIMELRAFLDSICTDSVLRAKYIYGAGDFSRKRILSFGTLVLFLVHTVKRSLNVELLGFFENISQTSACTKQAFSKQRRKLKALFFDDWNQKLITSFYSHYRDKYARWKGFRLLAVDGSTVPLPHTEVIKEMYGYVVNKTSTQTPMARICVLYDVLNEIAIQGLLHSYHRGERDGFLPILGHQKLSDSLLLFDRGYLSYWFIHLLLNKQAHFVIRAQSNAGTVIESFLKGSERDIITELYPSDKSKKKLLSLGVKISREDAIKVRLVKILLSTGETEVLVTNLYDKKLYPLRALKEVYNLRWGIETYYGYLKEELQLGVFSGTNPVCIQQDFAANLFLFNLQSIIQKQCEPTLEEISTGRKYRQKVNKNISWAALKYRVVRLFINQEPACILKQLESLFCRYTEPIRPNRKYPRTRKTVTSVKHHTLTNYKRAI